LLSIAISAMADGQMTGGEPMQGMREMMQRMMGGTLPPGIDPKLLPEPESVGARLLSRYCTQCHRLPGPGMHTAGEWPGVIECMQQRMAMHNQMMGGAEVRSTKALDVIRDYLRHYAMRPLSPTTTIDLDTPDGRYAISTHPSRGSISVVDIAQRKLLHTIATGPVPNYAVVTHDGRRVYVSNAGNDTVSEIDTSHWIVKRNFVVGKAPEHLLLSADEHRLYVNNVASGTVAVLDLDKGDVARTYSVGRAPHGLDLSDHGTTLFVSAQKDDKLVAIDLGSGAIKALPLAPAPYHVLAVRGQEKLYISSRKQPKIWVVDTKQFKVKGEIKIQGEGHQMALVP